MPLSGKLSGNPVMCQVFFNFFFFNLLHSMKMLCKDRPCTLCCLILFIMGSMAVVRMCRSEEVCVGFFFALIQTENIWTFLF